MERNFKISTLIELPAEEVFLSLDLSSSAELPFPDFPLSLAPAAAFLGGMISCSTIKKKQIFTFSKFLQVLSWLCYWVIEQIIFFLKVIKSLNFWKEINPWFGWEFLILNSFIENLILLVMAITLMYLPDDLCSRSIYGNGFSRRNENRHWNILDDW